MATADVWANLWETAWRHGEVEATLLAPLIASWLFWVRRERLRLCEPSGTWVGPAVVCGSWLLGLLGDATGTQLFVHVSALGIVGGCVLSVLGVDVLRHFLPVFGALLLLVPVPWVLHERVADPLSYVVADVSLLLYDLMGTEAERRGAWLVVGDKQVPVLTVCGAPGIKATFLIAYGLAFASPLKTWVRVLIVAVTPIAAVMTQVLGTLVAVGLVEMSGWTDHAVDLVTGWLILPVVFAVLFGLVKLLGWASLPVQYYTLAQDR